MKTSRTVFHNSKTLISVSPVGMGCAVGKSVESSAKEAGNRGENEKSEKNPSVLICNYRQDGKSPVAVDHNGSYSSSAFGVKTVIDPGFLAKNNSENKTHSDRANQLIGFHGSGLHSTNMDIKGKIILNGHKDDEDRILILHFNDVYNIEPREKEPVGGAARFASKIATFQSRNPLVLFSGDALNPSMS